MTKSLAASLIAAALVACTSDAAEQAAAAPAKPAPIGVAECAACGMVVREQPAPRGQVVHTDGAHVHLCALADLVLYLAEPSKHGKARAVFVEALTVDQPPSERVLAEQRWIDAASASYVLGVERPSIMGPAVIAYASEADAKIAAERYQGEVLGWDALRQRLLSR